MTTQKTKAAAPCKVSAASNDHQPAQFTLPLWPQSTPKPTKLERVLNALRGGASMNRFEAERIGEHCLNSTIAVLRQTGHLISGEWETVPTRFGKPARVLRYRYIGPRAAGNPFAELLGGAA
jgi:hypothetical protein